MTSSVRRGEILAGKYRVERELGAGGMGVVLLATHVQLEQRCAIKLLLPEVHRSADAAQRFMQEARAAARLRGEHVVRVHDVGELEDGSPYMVMEYLEGEDLAKLIERRGSLSLEEAVDCTLQVCEAIAEAHAAGIIHRDLKPANIFLATTPAGTRTVKILDFGISKIASGAGGAVTTSTRAFMGSPLYMPPEQMRSMRNTTPKVDVWALGVILYELLAGRPPFIADTMPEICARVLAEPVPPLGEFRPDLPPEIEAVIERCTAKDPTERIDIGGLALSLAPFASAAGRLSAEHALRVSRAHHPPDSETLGHDETLPQQAMNGEQTRPHRPAVGGTTAPNSGGVPLSASSRDPALTLVGPGVPPSSYRGPAAVPAYENQSELETGPRTSGLVVEPPAFDETVLPLWRGSRSPTAGGQSARTLATFGTTASPQGSRNRTMRRVGGLLALGTFGLVAGAALHFRVAADADTPRAGSALPPGNTPPATGSFPPPGGGVALRPEPIGSGAGAAIGAPADSANGATRSAIGAPADSANGATRSAIGAPADSAKRATRSAPAARSNTSAAPVKPLASTHMVSSAPESTMPEVPTPVAPAPTPVAPAAPAPSGTAAFGHSID